MPHAIYGRPSHQLEAIHSTIWLPGPRNGGITRATVRGETSTSKSALWTYSESWTMDEQSAGLQPADAVNHVILVALQDRVASQGQLEASLIGEGWAEVSLPF